MQARKLLSSLRPRGASPRGPDVRTALVVIAFALGAVACRSGHEPPPSPDAVTSAPPAASAASVHKRPPATAVELALVAPWKEGFAVGGFNVARVEAVEGGVFRVICKKEHASVALSVALTSDAGPLPPAGTDRFSVFYETRGAAPDEAAALATALAKVLETNASAAAPSDLGKFDPAAESGVEL